MTHGPAAGEQDVPASRGRGEPFARRRPLGLESVEGMLAPMLLSAAARSLAAPQLSFLHLCGISTEEVCSGGPGPKAFVPLWAGACAVGANVYAAPSYAPKLLVIDTADQTAYGIDTEGVHSGKWKWYGITAVGTKVYAAPLCAPTLLVVDTATDTAHGIDTEGVVSGEAKWAGVTALGTKVYAPSFWTNMTLVHDTVPVQGGMLAVVDGSGVSSEVEVSGFARLGGSVCAADDEHGPMAQLATGLARRGACTAQAAWADSVRACAELCFMPIQGKPACFGFEINVSAVCTLLGRGFVECAIDTLPRATIGPEAEPTFMAGTGMQLVHADATPLTLASLHRVGHACYKRVTNCSTAPKCAALNRYDCERGILPGVCDLCLPGFVDPDGAAGVSQGDVLCIAASRVPVVVVSSFVAFVMLAGILFALVYSRMKKTLRLQRKEVARLEKEKEQRVKNKVAVGVATIKLLQHPMCIVSMATFLAAPNETLFKNHEGMRDRCGLRFLDQVGDITAFLEEGRAIVFFSYQWLSWTHKGPNAVQRESMNSAVRRYREHSEVPVEEVIHIWLDILAIPQSNRGVQKLAVDSLYVYASAASVCWVQ